MAVHASRLPAWRFRRDGYGVNYPARLARLSARSSRAVPSPCWRLPSAPMHGRGAVHVGRSVTRRGFLRGFPTRGPRPRPTHPTLIPGVLALKPEPGPQRSVACGRGHSPRVRGRSTAAPASGPFWPRHGTLFIGSMDGKCIARASSPPCSLRSLRRGLPRYRPVIRILSRNPGGDPARARRSGYQNENHRNASRQSLVAVLE